MNIFDNAGPVTGYAEAKTGETFVRIGVGRVEKPEESGYRELFTYKVLDPGKWNIEQKTDSIRFIQELPDTASELATAMSPNKEPAGPNLIWTFPFEPITSGNLAGMAAISGRQIVYLRELLPGEPVLAILTGYTASPDAHRLTLENRKSGAGVRVSGDQPMSKLAFWSRRGAYSPEASIHLHILPGETAKWATAYKFYVTEQAT